MMIYLAVWCIVAAILGPAIGACILTGE